MLETDVYIYGRLVVSMYKTVKQHFYDSFCY